MIATTDIILLSIVCFLTFKTPANSNYKTVIWLLLAEFAVFIGFAAYIQQPGILTDVIFMLLNVIFMAGFLLLGATYLAKISGILAIYYAFIVVILGSNVNLDYHYGIMLILSTLQIVHIVPRVIDGYKRRGKRRIMPTHGGRNIERRNIHRSV